MPDNKITKTEEELEKKLSEIKKKVENDKYIAFAKQHNLPYSDLNSVPIDIEALSLLNEEVARSAHVVVIYKKDLKIVVATTDPTSPEFNKISSELKKNYELSIVVTNPYSLQRILERYQSIKKADLFEIGAIDIQEKELDRLENQISSISDLKNQINRVSTTILLEIVLAGALKTEASDIHLESEAEGVRLRYRLDGILHDIAVLDQKSYQKILSRIKVLSKMKLNIHNAPQDGRFTIRLESVSIEVRISVLPSEFGETLVMRLLDPRTVKKNLDELGMREDLLKKVMEVLKKPTGAVFTTGPTGSGKTTMLYAFVNYLNSPETKIITIEDPIEYHIDGISQTQVDASKNYTFSNGLRAIVRQDPDVILVGEIRDQETADIALQAALTGHLVFSTIHTNDAAGTIPRLIDLDIRPQIIAPAVNMAMAQRLVRKLCRSCKKSKKINSEDLKRVKEVLEPIKNRVSIPELNSNLEVSLPGKCKECNDSGYKGRTGVFEEFIMTKEIEKLISKSPSISEVRDLAISEGMITMMQDAYIKFVNRETSMEEIERVLG